MAPVGEVEVGRHRRRQQHGRLEERLQVGDRVDVRLPTAPLELADRVAGAGPPSHREPAHAPRTQALQHDIGLIVRHGEQRHEEVDRARGDAPRVPVPEGPEPGLARDLDLRVEPDAVVGQGERLE